MQQHMVTTVDNPWSPLTQWDEWLAYDTQAGHATSTLLARLSNSSDELSESDQDSVRESAIRVLCDEIGPGFYIMVPITDEN